MRFWIFGVLEFHLSVKFWKISQISINISASFTATSLSYRSHISLCQLLDQKLIILSLTHSVSPVAVKSFLDRQMLTFLTYVQFPSSPKRSFYIDFQLSEIRQLNTSYDKLRCLMPHLIRLDHNSQRALLILIVNLSADWC